MTLDPDFALIGENDQKGGITEVEPSQLLKKNAYAPVPVNDGLGNVREAEEIQNMSLVDIQSELENILCYIISRVGGDIQPPIDPDKPLVLLGMDSMSIIQFKGVLDNRFAYL